MIRAKATISRRVRGIITPMIIMILLSLGGSSGSYEGVKGDVVLLPIEAVVSIGRKIKN